MTDRDALTEANEALIRRTWNEPRSWPVPQLLAEIDRLRATPSPVPLDVERLGRAIHRVFCAGRSPMHSSPVHSADRLAAEFARLAERAEP